MADKKLYRSTRDKKLAGVCGGVAKYFNIDASIVRILWLALALFYFAGAAAYLIAVFVVPEEPY